MKTLHLKVEDTIFSHSFFKEATMKKAFIFAYPEIDKRVFRARKLGALYSARCMASAALALTLSSPSIGDRLRNSQ